MVKFFISFLVLFIFFTSFGAQADQMNEACKKLLGKYQMSQGSLELLRSRSSEDFRKKLSGEYDSNKAYADDMIPRVEWEITHITQLYIASDCNVNMLANYYVEEILNKGKTK